MNQTQEAPAATLKKIVVRKAGTVRLTAMCSNYCYGCCSCLRATVGPPRSSRGGLPPRLGRQPLALSENRHEH